MINKFNMHSHLTIPFINYELNLGAFYPIWIVIFLSGMSNASNLTDGLDGLSGGIYIASAIFSINSSLVSVPVKTAKESGIKSIQLSLSGYNLFFIDSLEYYNAEMLTGYPLSRSFQLGLKLTL